MIDIQHVNIKFFIEDPGAVDLEQFIGAFNGWIQEQATEELLIDVADYRHVFAGPGVVLVGHEANYSLDYGGNRPGLLYSRKAQLSGTTQEKFAQPARAALKACRKLEAEQGLKFSGRETQLIVNDRLLAPNTPQTFADLEPELRLFFNRLYGGAEYTLTHNADPRERFAVAASSSANADAQTLLANLASSSRGAASTE